MRIRISKDWWSHYVRGQFGKTQAEKEARAEVILEGPGRSWALSMGEAAGAWLDVETDYLFEDQFNTESLRVNVKYIDAIDFSPEFANVDEFQAAVAARYSEAWPGRVVKCSVLRSYIKSGLIEVK